MFEIYIFTFFEHITYREWPVYICPQNVIFGLIYIHGGLILLAPPEAHYNFNILIQHVVSMPSWMLM